MAQKSNSELLIRIDERVAQLLTRMDEMEGRINGAVPMSEHVYLMNKINDHDKKLDVLLTWKTQIFGIFIGVSVIFGFFSNVLWSFIKKQFNL